MRAHFKGTALALLLTIALSSCQSPAPQPANREVTTLATLLAAPWSMVPLADGSVLLSERDSGRIVQAGAAGTLTPIGEVAGVEHQGEGGLLGLALSPDGTTLYAYFTSADDNRIVRMPLLGTAGNRSLGPATPIITGIPKGSNHNGGRIKFGPDGMLYAGTGDAGNRNKAQDLASLGGKILRITPHGSIPTDNPFPGSPVWSLGHRNVQGLAWDATGRMWASEFGQNTWDELNEIKAGANYGWPVVEGKGADARFTDPVLQWPTSDASPSGIAIDKDTLYMASLRGERLWEVMLDGAPSATARLTGVLGRLRDVALTPDGRLLVLTNNTDGRGDPKQGDDKIVEITR